MHDIPRSDCVAALTAEGHPEEQDAIVPPIKIFSSMCYWRSQWDAMVHRLPLGCSLPSSARALRCQSRKHERPNNPVAMFQTVLPERRATHFDLSFTIQVISVVTDPMQDKYSLNDAVLIQVSLAIPRYALICRSQSENTPRAVLLMLR